jgi:acyl-CoA thioesterase FadM
VVAEGYIELAFIKSDTKKITRAPEFFTRALKKFFED